MGKFRKASFILNNQDRFKDKNYPTILDQELKVPKGVENVLNNNNNRLKELIDKYSSADNPATNNYYWDEFHVKASSIKAFRGETYLSQIRDANSEINYLLCAEYVKSIDHLGIFNILEEDNLFGIEYYRDLDNRIISRDLLDPIVEIYFLEKALGVSKLPNINVLDIGAGYGRLAYRMVEVLPNINKVFCVDGVAISTFIAEYYLSFRNVNEKAIAVPIYDLEQEVLENNSIDLAINIHSFSECSLESVEWWLNLLRKYEIRYLMIVPNDEMYVKELFTYPNKDGQRFNYSQLLKERGYQLIFEQPKYMNSLIQ